ncbi:ATP-dependent RNA helicase DHX33 [Holothuria leucospilota]|uniref:RNA helicase n=1 Tax=Holothuria leucospilota TaxID=206669 RepID=A0A9Q0YHI1_HOLLE|nr:ATP-dependent RNA helicase DHX33 [Holothuria leucospilota]
MEQQQPFKRQKHFHNRDSNYHKSYRPESQDLYQERCNLPIYSARGKLITEIRKASSSIVIGETGSGKTTQIPQGSAQLQYLLEAGVTKGKVIACTQPRRVAAISIAKRVSAEMGVDLGSQVGYTVRFDDTTSPQTKLKFMTDGMLLREAILDPNLSRYSVIILDEAHERTVHTDVLFGVVKAAQRNRQTDQKNQLKVVFMSATMDVDHFSNFFNSAPVLYVQGRQHPIQASTFEKFLSPNSQERLCDIFQLMYSVKPQSDYIYAALVAVFQIHQEYPANEDILVFLTGQEEIEGVLRAVNDVSKDLPSDVPGLVVYRLYAALPQAIQEKVFQKTPTGKRKVILSTNIAETSITIPGIKHVIDTGRVKAKSYQPGSGVDTLKVQWVSQAQAWQRTGRAGREDSGTCWRLYTEETFGKLPANTIPEIQRSNLASVVLQMLALKIKDVFHFDFMDPPTEESLKNAVEQLKLLGAVEDGINPKELKLTTLGKEMVAFPLDPRLSKVILAARNFGCLEEILTVVSLLSVDSVLNAPSSKREQAAQCWKKFYSTDGDHIMLLTIYRSFIAMKGSKNWCHENFVSLRNMKHAVEIRKQLKDLCVKAQLPLQSCGRETAPIRKCLVQGMFMNTAELQVDGTFMTLDRKQPVTIHPSSCLFNCKPSYLLFNELVQTSKSYIRNVCSVDSEWLYEAAPAYFRQRFGKR